MKRTYELQKKYNSAEIPVSWSFSFETGEYVNDPEKIIADSVEAVLATKVTIPDGNVYVNLVTPDKLGHPDGYLVGPLKEKFGDQVDIKFIDQCGCGGYVLRVWRVR